MNEEDKKPKKNKFLALRESVVSSPVKPNAVYNQTSHLVEIFLDNSGNYSTDVNAKVDLKEPLNRIYINPSAVLNLQIEDSFLDWNATGSLTFLFAPEAAAQGADDLASGVNPETNTKGKPTAVPYSFSFRGDGYDLLRVFVVPVVNKKTETNKDIEIHEADPREVLSYLFSVKNIQDITEKVPELTNGKGQFMRCYQLEFQDVRHHILETSNLDFSTGFPGLFTGEAIGKLLNQGLSNELGGGHEMLSVNYEQDKTWDMGSSSIFYTSPAGYSASDDLDYLLAQHVSSTSLTPLSSTITPPLVNDLSFLVTTEPRVITDIKPLSLRPLKSFFKAATENGNIVSEETFVVTTQGAGQQNDPEKQYFGHKQDKVAPTIIPRLNQILNYSFVDMAAEVNATLMRSSSVHSVSIREGKFRIENKNHNVSFVKDIIGANYISKLINKETKTPANLLIPTLHQSKKYLNKFPTFSLNGDNLTLRQKNVFHQLLYTGLFQNSCICFQVLGFPRRQPGSIISIDYNGGNYLNEHTVRLCGQWFITEISRNIESGVYVDNIYAIKLHKFKTQHKYQATIENPSISNSIGPE